ncbi:MAG: class I SAM-dependent methyltransferase [Kiritimatiellia bacterium]
MKTENDVWTKMTQQLYANDNYRRMPEVYRFIISTVQANKGHRVLDIGCGDGSLLEQIKGKSLHGIDISKEQLAKAVQKGITVHQVNLDSEPIPYPAEHFDIIISSEVIEHVLVPDLLLREARRVLNKDGIFILTTPNLASFGKRLLLLFNRNPFIECSPLEPSAVGHVRYFIFSTLKSIVERNGFALDEFTSDVVNFDRSGRLCSRFLAQKVPSLGRTLMVILKKAMPD